MTVETKIDHTLQRDASVLGHPAPSRLRYFLGVTALTFVVIGWVGTNFLTNEILQHYEKPFLMTVLGCFSLQSYFMFMLLGDPLKPASALTGAAAPLTVRETARLALMLFAVYFGMNYFSTISFGLTSPGSASIIASTCGFFTLIMGAIARVEKLSWLKVLAVVISAGGVTVLGIAEFTGAGNRAIGNACALAGAALYGVHSTLLKRAVGDESRVSTLNFFAFIGLYVTLCAGPFFYLLHWTGVETCQLPPSPRIWVYMAINIIFGSLIPNYLWNIAFLYTSQLVVAIGISFTTPLTLAIEYLRDPSSVSWQQVASAACIAVAFAVVNLAELRPDFDRSLTKCNRTNRT